MIEAEIPRNEPARLRALKCLNLLESASERRFDHIVEIAKELFDVPVVLISLIDEKRQWFKSKAGIDQSETPREVSFCSHALVDDQPVIVEDALIDERFFDNPLVRGDFNLRFYAGYPIHSPEGYPLGTICLIDHAPRTFNNTDLKLLRHLADLVDKEIAATHVVGKDAPNSIDSFGDFLQKVGNFISLKPVSIALSSAVFLIVLIMTSRHYVHSMETEYLEQQTTIAGHLSNIRGRLETELNARLHLTQGLAGLVRAAPGNLDHETFLSFAQDLGSSLTAIRSLQLAPGGVVEYLWPVVSNSPALGHDLLADPNRRSVAEKAIENRKLWIAGPLELIQGGTALIGRLPVFLPYSSAPGTESSEEFWGFATVLIDLDDLLQVSDFYSLSRDFDVALRGRNGLGSDGETFVGSSEVFEGRYQSAIVSMPAGSWEIGISIMPSPNLVSVPPHKWALFTAVALVISLLLYGLMRLPFRYVQAVDSAKQALAASNARFKDAIEALPDGFAVFDEHDRLVRCNQRYREFFATKDSPLTLGLSFEEVLRESINAGVYKLADGSTAAQNAFLDLRMSHHRSPSSTGLELTLSNGRWLRAVESRVPSGGTVIAYTDVSELKRKEHELASEKLRAESANEAKTAFLATVSHELRTPLNAILGMLNLLKVSGRMQSKDQEYLDLTHDSAEHLLNLLNELLDLSKMEANKLELESNEFNLAAVTRKAVKLCETKAEQKHVALECKLDPSSEVMVKGDAGRLQQILLNLLSNGIKFTDQGSVTLSVVGEKTSLNHAQFRFCVQDTGVGFTSAQAETLFQPFLQLDSTASRKHEGTGLGLAICKRLTELMGGKISAEGEPGKGASFELEIPFEISDAKNLSESFAEQPDIIPKDLGRAPIRVLIAEDSPANQIVFRAMLESTGYYPDIVGNGLEAVQAVQDFNYDIILMDIFMPEMDGIEATKTIRKISSAHDTPIIALTANAMPGDQDKFLNAGMDDYLAKPLNKSTLIQMLNKWMLQPSRV